MRLISTHHKSPVRDRGYADRRRYLTSTLINLKQLERPRWSNELPIDHVRDWTKFFIKLAAIADEIWHVNNATRSHSTLSCGPFGETCSRDAAADLSPTWQVTCGWKKYRRECAGSYQYPTMESNAANGTCARIEWAGLSRMMQKGDMSVEGPFSTESAVIAYHLMSAFLHEPP
jgi:hypothetical protein